MASVRRSMYDQFSIVFIFSEEVGDYPFHMLGINTSGCSQRDQRRLSFCVQRIKQQFLVANCNVNITDHRIPCRKATDPMTWYRGTQSITVSGKSCMRWDSVSSDIFASKFDELDAPSLLHSMSATFSQGIHAHENYCRNPDGWSRGPWCIVEVLINFAIFLNQHYRSSSIAEPLLHQQYSQAGIVSEGFKRALISCCEFFSTHENEDHALQEIRFHVVQ
ncbi:unnamed protein product [Toxocara canis]|uniref:Kringle domain-containing protein n=1 Tax=Toxocara canis TaxID=6265 RepID=A0A183U4P2_TOXCA|nr:unnamed protein product [Toxocara canis]